MVILRIKTLLIPARNIRANPKLLRIRVYQAVLGTSGLRSPLSNCEDGEDYCREQKETFPK
jgi:hypothetical protein